LLSLAKPISCIGFFVFVFVKMNKDMLSHEESKKIHKKKQDKQKRRNQQKQHQNIRKLSCFVSLFSFLVLFPKESQ
jgi:hypothetical protein